jgi:Yip1 domain
MPNIQTRVVNILKTPKTEWPVIAAEATDVGRLYREYIIPLAAIPPVASFIGLSLLGSVFTSSVYFRASLGAVLLFALVSYALSLVGVFVAALVIEWLAPKFNSSGTRVAALKLVAYSCTAPWVFGALNAIPVLGILVLIGSLYGIYLCYVGLPVVMKTPADQVVVYLIVAIVVMIVIQLVLGSIAGALLFGSAFATHV